MLDLKQVNDDLSTYIRPHTYPVAIKLLDSVDAIPPKARLPKDLGIQMATCQAISFARHYGWTVAVTREEHSCSPGMLVLGFAEPNELYTSGSIAKDMYCGSLAAGAAMEAAIPKFAPGKYKAFVAGPIDRVDFEPDVIAVYANTAQVMRLVQGALFHRGGTLKAEAQGRLDCSDIVVRTLQTGECQWVLPCTGDRIFAMAADDELCFAMPVAKVAEVLEGVRETHRFGVRYPVPVNLQWTAKYPPKYQQLREMLLEQE